MNYYYYYVYLSLKTPHKHTVTLINPTEQLAASIIHCYRFSYSKILLYTCPFNKSYMLIYFVRLDKDFI